MNATYKIERFDDLLKVPTDRREDCVRELLMALLLHELAFGDEAQATRIQHLTWTDDGKKDCALTANGKPLLALNITKASA